MDFVVFRTIFSGYTFVQAVCYYLLLRRFTHSHWILISVYKIFFAVAFSFSYNLVFQLIVYSLQLLFYPPQRNF